MFGNIVRDSHIPNNENENSDDDKDVNFSELLNLFAYSKIRA
jgi:hypothetical protein